MQIVTRRIRIAVVTVMYALAMALPMYAHAAIAPVAQVVDSPDVFITEFQTNGGSASQEFIEIYNATDADIEFADTATSDTAVWKIQFFNSASVKSGLPAWATAASASNAITLAGTIAAHDYFVLSSKDYAPAGVEPDQSYEASGNRLMTDTGGGLQLLSTDSQTDITVHDRTMWLDPATNPVMPYGVLPKPGTGKSQQRIPNSDMEYVTDGNMLLSFEPKENITPMSAWTMPEPAVLPPVLKADEVAEDVVPTDSVLLGSSDTATGVNNNIDANDIVEPMITELLPNPGAPLTDDADEFIEIYNPNANSFDLEGYRLQVGTATLRTFTFVDGAVIPGQGYAAYYSRDTRLALSNSGGQARLLNPAGDKVSETLLYSAAADDASWMLKDGLWQWSDTPTPGIANILTDPAGSAVAKTAATAAAAKATAAKKAAAKATTAKLKGTTTTKKAKAVKPKAAAKTKVKKPKTARISTTAAVKPKPPIHTGILVAIAISAVLYGLYEYRHDIYNRFAQLREHRAARRSGGKNAEWRRGYSTQ